ncbi:MAG TPA: hypothetical protein VGQ26_12895 [Streptosporangiaceae bacterium]|jgi:hypothetical protein|nr:hypothetical protein [Streptosporangiaceae bacterium]
MHEAGGARRVSGAVRPLAVVSAPSPARRGVAVAAALELPAAPFRKPLAR